MAGYHRKTWKEALAEEQPLLLPCAHDALSARLIERTGFSAYSIGGFALVGSRYGIPDIGLAAYGEISAGIRDIMAATSLPVTTPTEGMPTPWRRSSPAACRSPRTATASSSTTR